LIPVDYPFYIFGLDSQFQDLRSLVKVESKTLEGRIDGLTVKLAVIVTACVAVLQALAALGIVTYIKRRMQVGVNGLVHFAFSTTIC
jgi:hypothetical protein